METLHAVFPASHYTLLAVIVLLPLLGAFVNGVFGRRAGKEAVTLMGLASVGGAFVLSVVTFLMLKAEQTGEQAIRFTWTGWKWLGLSRLGEMDVIRDSSAVDLLELDVALSVDALSGTMALVVTGVGFLIHLYSTKYMEEDPGYHRFFAYLNLFIFSMLVLILGDSLPVLFVGWEGVGLCSYLLIGFWYGDQANAAAGKKAFITNRIGDFGLLVAMALLVKYTGALSWDSIETNAAGLLTPVTVWSVPFLQGVEWAESLGIAGPHQVSAATLVGLSLFLGCAGKSAQIPLYVWLPDAMAGPTPVSALIHAATMVTAGVYLVCRMAPVFVLSPAVMFTVALIGALTAVFAASIAFVQNDIKKVLAYSTVSQLGYMFLGVGVGAFTAGFFHVLTHAFFKACLFLGAGSVIHAMHARIHDSEASQDVRNMGGLRKYLPTTHWTFLASVLAIIGLPLTSGFFSKDAILLGAFTHSIEAPRGGVLQSQLGPVELFQWPEWGSSLLLGLGVVGAVMTAFYMVRLYILTFMGQFKGWSIVPGWTAPADAAQGHGHAHGAADLEGGEPHESPWQMTFPLMVLGLLALFAGFLNAHLFHLHAMDDWLAPVFRAASGAVVVNAEAAESLVVGLAVAAFFAGSVGAYWVFVQQNGEPAKDFAERFPAFHRLLVDKWRVDELYDELVIGTVDFIAEVCVWVDVHLVDGIIAGVSSWTIRAAGHLLRLAQNGRVHVYSASMVVGTAAVGWFLVVPHPEAVIDADPEAGRFGLTAAPGLGYEYRWDADGDEAYDSDEFGDRTSIQVALGPEERQRVVRLEVRNAFGHTSESTFELRRPGEVEEESAMVVETRPTQLARGAGEVAR